MAQQQIGEGILQLGMDHAHGAGASPHHVPVLTVQSVGVDLLEQCAQASGCSVRCGQAGVDAQATAQQIENFGLLHQGMARPEPLAQLLDRGIVELLFLIGREITQIGDRAQQGRLDAAGGFRGPIARDRWKREPLTLRHQCRNPVDPHLHAIDGPVLAFLQQIQNRPLIFGEEVVADRQQQKWKAPLSPVTLQQMELVDNGVEELHRVIRQVAGAVFQHGRRHRIPLVALAVEPGRLFRIDPFHRTASEAKARVGANMPELGLQLLRTQDDHLGIVIHGDSGLLERIACRLRLRCHCHQHRC